MSSYQLGVRHVSITGKRFYDTREEATTVVSRIAEQEIVDEFSNQAMNESETQFQIGDDDYAANNWAVFQVTDSDALEVRLQFIGTNVDVFLSLLREVLDVVDTLVLVQHETELRLNTGFSMLNMLPIDREADENVTGVEITTPEFEYRFTRITDSETAIVVGREDDVTLTPPVEEYYETQLDDIVAFVTDYVPQTPRP